MPVRRIGLCYRSVSGRVPMGGGRRTVAVESTLERDFALLQRFDRDVVGLEEQPVRISYRDAAGAKRSYVPDFLVTYRQYVRLLASFLVAFFIVDNDLAAQASVTPNKLLKSHYAILLESVLVPQFPPEIDCHLTRPDVLPFVFTDRMFNGDNLLNEDGWGNYAIAWPVKWPIWEMRRIWESVSPSPVFQFISWRLTKIFCLNTERWKCRIDAIKCGRFDKNIGPLLTYREPSGDVELGNHKSSGYCRSEPGQSREYRSQFPFFSACEPIFGLYFIFLGTAFYNNFSIRYLLPIPILPYLCKRAKSTRRRRWLAAAIYGVGVALVVHGTFLLATRFLGP